ncbi:hypothetical protein GBF38_010792, partial [Nibea albiflora]
QGRPKRSQRQSPLHETQPRHNKGSRWFRRVQVGPQHTHQEPSQMAGLLPPIHVHVNQPDNYRSGMEGLEVMANIVEVEEEDAHYSSMGAPVPLSI